MFRKLTLAGLLIAACLHAQGIFVPGDGGSVSITLSSVNPSGSCVASTQVFNYRTGHTWACTGTPPGAMVWTDTAAVNSGGLTDPGANGVVKRTALNTTGNALYSDITSLFGGGSCVGYLKNDGTCSTPAAGGGTWGSITGTLSNQTDLATALSGKQATLSSYATVVGLFNGGACSGYLKSDGTCATPAGSGSPGGANTQIQYNASGSFAGDSGLTYNSTSHLLTATGGFSSGGSSAGFAQFGQGTANTCGANALCFEAPTSITTTTKYIYPSAAPTAGQTFAWSAPSSGVSTGSLITPVSAFTCTGATCSISGNTATITVTGGSGATLTGTGKGYLNVWGEIGTTTANVVGTDVWDYQFVSRYSGTFNKLVYYINAAAASSSHGVAWVIKSADESSTVCTATPSTGTTITTATSLVQASFASPCTLTANTAYKLWFVTDDSTITIQGYPSGDFYLLLNADTTRVGFCSNAKTGTGASLAFPATCGTLTPATNRLPYIMLVP